jgi:hypothetical protein
LYNHHKNIHKYVDIEYNLYADIAIDALFGGRLNILSLIDEIKAGSFNLDIDSEDIYKCNITIDDYMKEYRFKNKDSLERDFQSNFNISCNKKLNSYQLQILNEDKVVKTIKKKYYKLEPKKLKTNILINCSINKDGLIKDIKKKEYFLENFNINCKNTQEIEIEIYSLNYSFYDKINSTKFVYNKDTISKPYNTILYLNDNWIKSNKCILLTDKTKITKTFTNKTKRRDWIINNSVGNVINLNCQYKIKEINLYIDNRQYKNEHYNNTYYNTSKINININNVTCEQIPKKEIKVINTKNKEITKPSTVIKQIVKQKEIIVNNTLINSTIQKTKPIIIAVKKNFWDFLYFWK